MFCLADYVLLYVLDKGCLHCLLRSVHCFVFLVNIFALATLIKLNQKTNESGKKKNFFDGTLFYEMHLL